ncbi:MAG: methionyl-tRNA formyltransferase [Actinomycetota bacterium]
MEGSRALRVSFLGSDRWSVAPLEALVRSRHDLILVATRAPKPAGRGNRLTPTPIAEAARRLEIPLVEVETVRAGRGFESLADSRSDVLVVVAYGEVLPGAVLGLPVIAPVNLHFSLLPRYRGAGPVQAALRDGLHETGVTTMVIEERLDAGPILLQRSEPIYPSDDAGSLGARLSVLGARVLVETLDLLSGGELHPKPQDDRLATFAPKVGPADRVIDWSKAARELVNLVRALAPEPAAETGFRGRSLKVLRAEAVEASGEPGTVVEAGRDGLVVATGEGGFRPLEIVPAGRKRMSAAEFVRGFRPLVGEHLS